MTDGAAIAALLASGFAAGVMNSLAGGGTILTFPTLTFLGMDSIRANATTAVAFVPAHASSMWGYRRDVATHTAWLGRLLVPSILGGAIGSLLLLLTPERVFAGLAPWLVLFATLLFFVQIVRARSADAAVAQPDPARRLGIVWAYQFGVAVYGGYFGAGIGILMLVALTYLGLTDIHAMNGLKNFFGLCINATACLAFIVAGLVDWRSALIMAVGATAGGFAGAKFARRIGKQKARWAVVAIGLFVTAAMLWDRYRGAGT